MSNTTGDSCGLPQSFWTAVSGANYAAFYILMPLRFIFGFTGQLMALTAFKQQTNTETAYAYQIFVTFGKLVEISFYVLHVLFQYHWAGGIGGIRPGTGAGWFRGCYGCMWYVAHVCGTVLTMMITLSLLLATAMAVDRAFALAKPFLYRRINHKRHQLVAVISCVAISFLVSLDSSWRTRVTQAEPGLYSIVNNGDYNRNPLAVLLNLSRMTLRFVGVGVMGVCYVVVIKFFEKRIKQAAHASHRGATKKELERKRHQKTLYVLVLFELPFTLLSTLLLAATNMLSFFAPQVHVCEGALLFAFASISTELVDTMEIYVILAASPTFRAMVMNAVPGLKSLTRTPTSKIITAPNANY